MQHIIEYRNISKQYGEQTALCDINLSIAPGAFVTIIGSSGCGKTTLLKLVNGLVTPSEGDVLVDAQNIKDKDIIAHRRSIGYAIQGSVLFPHMTVAENIAYVPNLSGKGDRAARAQLVHHWLDMVGLAHSDKDRYPTELSGGQQQRVGIARALAASPKILLMDEPFGAVDEITRAQLQQELKHIHEKTGITVLFVTHDIDEALLLGTQVLIMDKGSIHQYDTPANICANPATDYVKRLLGPTRMNGGAQH